MKDEVAKIIAMLQEGKISSDEAEELISALKAEPDKGRTSSNNFLGKMLKVRIKSGTRENVNVNVPIKIVKTMLRMGQGIAANIPQAKEHLDDVDFELILNAIDNEIEGKIVDIQSDDGDIVEIYIE